jgi:predicted enzyme related to lactoylglutathione lyase
MTTGIRTVIYPVTDLARAKARFAALLGVAPAMDEAYYVQFNLGDLEVGLDPNGHGKGMTGAAPYWKVDDIKASFEQLVAEGAEVVQEITDFGGGGRQVGSVKDADGNVIGLLQE